MSPGAGGASNLDGPPHTPDRSSGHHLVSESVSTLASDQETNPLRVDRERDRPRNAFVEQGADTRIIVSGQRIHLPQLDRAIVTDRGEPAAVGGEGHAGHRTRVSGAV